MVRFTELFKEEMESATGETFEPSALQAIRWFFFIDTAYRLGYTKATTDDTISGYTERYIAELETDPRRGRAGNSPPRERVRDQTQGPQARSEEGPQGLTQFMPQGIAPRSREATPRRAPRMTRFMMPGVADLGVTEDTLERFR